MLQRAKTKRETGQVVPIPRQCVQCLLTNAAGQRCARHSVHSHEYAKAPAVPMHVTRQHHLHGISAQVMCTGRCMPVHKLGAAWTSHITPGMLDVASCVRVWLLAVLTCATLSVKFKE